MLKADLNAASVLHSNGKYNASAQRIRRVTKSLPRRFEKLLRTLDLPDGLHVIPYLGRLCAMRQGIVYGDRTALKGADSLEFAGANSLETCSAAHHGHAGRLHFFWHVYSARTWATRHQSQVGWDWIPLTLRQVFAHCR